MNTSLGLEHRPVVLPVVAASVDEVVVTARDSAAALPSWAWAAGPGQAAEMLVRGQRSEVNAKVKLEIRNDHLLDVPYRTKAF